jgi:ADP-ribose pyrophosphatase YjhB (NUDIX family)
MGLATVPRAAVAVTVIRTHGAQLDFLLVKRTNPPRAGSWSIPGGKIELGETTLAAEARELAEETRLGPDDGIRFYPWSIASSDVITRDALGRVEFHYVIAQMLAFVRADAQPVAGDDASDVRWVTIDEVDGDGIELGGNVSAILKRAQQLIDAGVVCAADAICVDAGHDAPEYLVER